MERPAAWLEALLSEKFFVGCEHHVLHKKNERNIYCVDCHVGICQHCVIAHPNHKLVQVRRYVYHDVVRISDLQKLVDVSGIQNYIINSAKVAFLNQRPQPRPPKGLGNACLTCDRSLQEPYRYCCVACKVDYLVDSRADLSCLTPKVPFYYSGLEGSSDSPSTSLYKFSSSPFKSSPKPSFMRRSRSEMQFSSLARFPPPPLDTSDTSSDSLEEAFGGYSGYIDAVGPQMKRSRSTPLLPESLESPQSTLMFGAATTSRRKGKPQRAPLW